jgi:hypothetical protein
MNNKTFLLLRFFSILTNHEVTYCFRINEEKDVTGRDVARVYVSDPISRENQFMAVFFILLLRYPQLTPNGFKECIEEVLLKVNEDLGKHIEQGPLNKSQNLNLKSDNNERKRKRNGKQPNGQEHSDYTKLELDIYKHYKDDAEVFYSNENYVLAKFVSQGKEFVIKCCDLFNSSKEARDEIRNEMTILEFINNELGKNKHYFLLVNKKFTSLNRSKISNDTQIDILYLNLFIDLLAIVIFSTCVNSPNRQF